MALFTSIDQVSKPTTANFKTPIKQFDVDDVVHIKDFTKEKIEEKLWQELSKLNKTV